MTKDELITRLKECAERNAGDPEAAHLDADELLLEYINDPDIKEVYDSFGKWYA